MEYPSMSFGEECLVILAMKTLQEILQLMEKRGINLWNDDKAKAIKSSIQILQEKIISYERIKEINDFLNKEQQPT